ncbi:HesA/MoeB/ThiF family protein, partial [Fulvivirga lutimaris]|uniref:HesA/MoeB/ThiF family protein n=1 Tax=Fulvivirga lutimaris TaxID=1819566 RepID=UPI0016270B65
MLSHDEIKRYQRHFVLPNFGPQAQEKLKKSSVLIVGLGALGSPASLYLAAAGVGKLGLVDADTINITNLQRQILYKESDIKAKKIDKAKASIAQLNQHVELITYPQFLTSQNALEILSDYDLIIDCTDNFPTRYLINDACILLNKPYVYGSIHQYEGQVSVFNAKSDINYRDLFPEPPNPESVPNCEEGGVLGSLAGIIGSTQ